MKATASSKIQYFLQNFYWMFIHMLVTTIFPFLIRSLMIRKWGIEYAGISGLFESILRVLNIAELGMGSAILYSMYKPMAEHDIPTVNALLNLYRKIYRNLGIGICIIGLILLPGLQFLIEGQYPSDVNIYIVYIIQLLNTVIGYILFFYWIVILQADQKVGIDYKIGAIVTGIMYSLQLLIIYRSYNYYLYAILLPIATLIINWIRAIYVQRTYPAIHCEGDVERSFLSDFYKRVFAMALSKIRTAIRGSIDSIVISASMGLIVLAQYQNYYQIMLIPVLLVGIVKGAIVPEFGVSVATESPEGNYKIFELYSFVNNWISMWCMVCLLCIGQNFICLWIDVENMLSDSVLVLFCIYFYLRSISDNATMIREATGVWWIGKEGAVIESLLNLVLDILLVRYWGIQGVLIATIIALLCINLPFEYISIFQGYFNKNLKRYFFKQIVYLINVIIISIATYMICREFPVGNFKMLIMEALICIFVPNVLYILLNYYRKEFKLLIHIAYNSILRRKQR